MRGRVSARRGESAGGETCPCGGGERGEGSLLAGRPVHAGEGGRGGVGGRPDMSHPRRD